MAALPPTLQSGVGGKGGSLFGVQIRTIRLSLKGQYKEKFNVPKI